MCVCVCTCVEHFFNRPELSTFHKLWQMIICFYCQTPIWWSPPTLSAEWRWEHFCSGRRWLSWEESSRAWIHGLSDSLLPSSWSPPRQFSGKLPSGLVAHINCDGEDPSCPWGHRSCSRLMLKWSKWSHWSVSPQIWWWVCTVLPRLQYVSID